MYANPFPERECRNEYLLTQSSVRNEDLPSVNAKTARQRGVRSRSVMCASWTRKFLRGHGNQMPKRIPMSGAGAR
ncbi:hypothetical protein NDU88_010390 [Pleurodeles waltl]|uniref:Uncharacterized protein n=1 Tax=Pleurodeles waltl TaxID=8319 RepID=A0AAV7PVJ0_PLEWA|nr:hypothetical protein NDU88_010389 [Pleurodeles waltl]KAJ1132060.1 hypothetical protein NDU88_010390 [Pleurodeles waltl]